MTGNAEDNRQVKPDPLNPMLFNGDFELVKEDYDFLIGWYYQRQVKLVSDNEAAQGDHFAQFSNETPGLSSHMLQDLRLMAEPLIHSVSGSDKATRCSSGPHS